MSYSINALIFELKRDEGVVLKPYKDSVGKLSVGVGRNLDDRGITQDEAEYMLQNDLALAEHELDGLFPKWRQLSDARQRVLMNMMFNMGRTRLSGFVKMWAAIAAGRFDDAATEMLDSKWATQVGARAQRLADMMRAG